LTPAPLDPYRRCVETAVRWLLIAAGAIAAYITYVP
jgi:hypothetical protein